MASPLLMRQLLGDPLDGEEDIDADVYDLFSHPITSSLGIFAPNQHHLSLTLGSFDLTLSQSPTLLSSSSSRPDGTNTTGAVLWSVTPRLAAWLLQQEHEEQGEGRKKRDPRTLPCCVLRRLGTCFGPGSVVLELGCGVTGLLGLSVGRTVARWICSDQAYVIRTLRANLDANPVAPVQSGRAGVSGTGKETGRGKGSARPGRVPVATGDCPDGRIVALELDWSQHELAEQQLAPSSPLRQVDVVLASDCTYNPSLIPAFVRTCVAACRLRSSPDAAPSLCVVAQQLRDAEVFELWLTEFARSFDVWRIADRDLSADLQSHEGYCVHVGILKPPIESGDPP